MSRTTFLIAFLCTTLAYASSINYEVARRDRRLQAVRVTEKLEIDGRLDETVWSTAPVAGDFIQNDPRPDDPASEKTEVKVLYDKENLYFGVSCYDSQRSLVHELKKDFTRTSGDSFEIVLDTFHDERNGYQFAINAAGAKWDAQMTNEGREVNENWDAIWSVRTQLHEDGWTAEIAIPFKTLKFRDTDVQTWGINFQRKLRRKNEDSYWSPLPRIYELNRVSLAGTLEGLEDVRPGVNIRIKPSVIATAGQFSNGDRVYTGDVGLDAKYGITAGLTWDFTYNTDFSQVEADNQQINLTRFNLFFPEKREFFLENSGIFQFSGGSDRGPNRVVPSNDMLFFFSRRIGLSDQGEPIPILGGTRLTGRTGPFELGFLNIHQREQGSSAETNFTVARFRHNLFGNSDVGVMVNNKEVQDSPDFNRVIGADANLRFGQSWILYSYLAKSFTPESPGKDWAGRVSLHYQSNQWDIRTSYTDIQEHFTNDMGFVPRTGMRKIAGFAGRSIRPQKVRKIFRNVHPHGAAEYFLNPNGDVETAVVDYHFQLEFQNGATAEVGLNKQRELLLEPFLINRRHKVVIPTGDYSFYEYLIQSTSDRSRKLSGNFQILIGPFYTGYKHTYTVGSILRLNHQFNASFTHSHNNINLPQGHFKTNLLNIRANYSFSTTLFLNALIQYNSDARQWSSNIRFNLIHRPLSDFYLVYNERRDSTSGDLIDRAIIAKLTYMIAH
ncbi:MAG: carbohydrate binding family 9 domain-containing protein [Acidobacteria bacterium]|nr:carbohydrate binding family 9 domain-containing protein [Acidobacteriota bacterium]